MATPRSPHEIEKRTRGRSLARNACCAGIVLVAIAVLFACDKGSTPPPCTVGETCTFEGAPTDLTCTGQLGMNEGRATCYCDCGPGKYIGATAPEGGDAAGVSDAADEEDEGG